MDKLDRFAVDIFEFERGWGSRLEVTKYFPTRKEAEKFKADHNSKNNKSLAPDVYWKAFGPREVRL